MGDEHLDQLVRSAAEALARNELVRALALADQITATEPEDATGRIIRAHALLTLGSDDEAFREGQIAALLDPESDDAQMVLGLTAWKKRRIALAEEAFQKAVSLSGGNADFVGQYAWFLASERSPKQAMKLAESAIEHSPQSAMGWAALGWAQYKLFQTTEAETSLRKALEINPRCPEACSAMIQVLKRRGNARQAESLQTLLEDRPGGMVYLGGEGSEDENSGESSNVVDLIRPRVLPARVKPLLACLMVIAVLVTLLVRHPVIALVSFLLAILLAYGYRRVYS